MAPIASYGLFLIILATKTGKYIHIAIIILATVKIYFVIEESLHAFWGAAGLMIYQPVQNIL